MLDKRYRKVLDIALLVIWMLLIVVMSSQPAAISDQQSRGVIEIIQSMGINISDIFGSNTNFIIRKCAHFFEYFILGLLGYNVLRHYFKQRNTIVLSIVFVILFATSDEIHQLFVVGREGHIRDVIIDSLGGITAVCFRHISSKRSVDK